MRRLVGVIGLLVALALTAATADAATDSVRHQWSNVAEGCGDVIDMQGTMHGVFTITENAGGGFLLAFHANPQGMTGVSLVTGATYQAAGVTRWVNTVHPPGGTYTYVNNFWMIGQGTATNLLVHQVVHYTVTPEGVFTVDFDRASIECR